MPWLFDDEAVDVLRFFNQLKTRLMPYLLDAAHEAHQHGWPILRAMNLEFPNDPVCRYLDTQYMLGPALLGRPDLQSRRRGILLSAGRRMAKPAHRGNRPGTGLARRKTRLFQPALWVHTGRRARWECLLPEGEAFEGGQVGRKY